MKTQPGEFHEFVEDDLRQDRGSHASGKANGAEDFQAKFREAMAWIEWNPELFQRKERHFRRAIMRKTHFGIFYVIEPGVIVAVAVLDSRRNPKLIRRLVAARVTSR